MCLKLAILIVLSAKNSKLWKLKLAILIMCSQPKTQSSGNTFCLVFSLALLGQYVVFNFSLAVKLNRNRIRVVLRKPAFKTTRLINSRSHTFRVWPIPRGYLKNLTLTMFYDRTGRHTVPRGFPEKRLHRRNPFERESS